MEATHPHLTTQKSFYVEISRARDRAELVTDDAKALREQLEAVTGERISALEGIGEIVARRNKWESGDKSEEQLRNWAWNRQKRCQGTVQSGASTWGRNRGLSWLVAHTFGRLLGRAPWYNLPASIQESSE